MNRVSTKVRGLDNILQGGLPQSSLILISGSPGTGKTVLALQILFGYASPQSKAIYFNTLTESTDRLIAYHQAFLFFEQKKINHELHIVDLAEIVRTGDQSRILASIIGKVQETEASLVAIDHFLVVSEMVANRTSLRVFLGELAQNLSIFGCTMLVLGEYSLSEALSSTEATVADGLLHLELAPDGISRILRVPKMRGTNSLMGDHRFYIDSNGITVLPYQAQPPARRAKFWSWGAR